MQNQPITLTINPQPPTARNRILFQPAELQNNVIHLPLDDPRATHIHKTLRSHVGDTVRIGIINGAPGTAVVRRIDTSFLVLEIASWQPPIPRYASLQCRAYTQPSHSANIRLLLALPRPKALKRLLPILSTLGIGHVLLIGAARVERPYWSTTLLSDKPALESLLVEGMEQSTDTTMPSVLSTLSLKAALALVSGSAPPAALHGFVSHTHMPLEAQLQEHVFQHNELWVVAHPGAEHDLTPSFLASQLDASRGGTEDVLPRLNVVIGPEGGWQLQELAWLQEACGVPGVALGPRVMTTTTSVVATTTVAAAMRALVLETEQR